MGVIVYGESGIERHPHETAESETEIDLGIFQAVVEKYGDAVHRIESEAGQGVGDSRGGLTELPIGPLGVVVVNREVR